MSKHARKHEARPPRVKERERELKNFTERERERTKKIYREREREFRLDSNEFGFISVVSGNKRRERELELENFTQRERVAFRFKRVWFHFCRKR